MDHQTFNSNGAVLSPGRIASDETFSPEEDHLWGEGGCSEPIGDSIREPTGDATESKLTRITIDWTELEGALENNSPEIHSYFNQQTGDVIRVSEEQMSMDRRQEELEADPDYLYVEPISSREQYRWMEEFIQEIEDCPLKERLRSAVDGKGAFRRFKNALMDDTEKREQWFAKRSVKLQAHIREWLQTHQIEPENGPPDKESAATRKVETIRKHRYCAAPNRVVAASQRRTAHELIDQIAASDLQIAVAFLEFLERQNRYADSD